MSRQTKTDFQHASYSRLVNMLNTAGGSNAPRSVKCCAKNSTKYSTRLKKDNSYRVVMETEFSLWQRELQNLFRLVNHIADEVVQHMREKYSKCRTLKCDEASSTTNKHPTRARNAAAIPHAPPVAKKVTGFRLFCLKSIQGTARVQLLAALSPTHLASKADI